MLSSFQVALPKKGATKTVCPGKAKHKNAVIVLC